MKNILAPIIGAILFCLGALWILPLTKKASRSNEGATFTITNEPWQVALMTNGTLLFDKAEVEVGEPVLERFTNCIEIVHCDSLCRNVRYIKDGRTNDFHAFGVPVHVIHPLTNFVIRPDEKELNRVIEEVIKEQSK